jgi:phage terminase large subunit-like protein
VSILRDQILRSFDTRKISVVEFAESTEFCNKPLFPRQRVLLKIMYLEELDGWEEDIVTEWLTDGEARISPGIRERIGWLRENGYNHFPEIQLVGGRRSSKGYITSVAVGKKMYDTWKLGDPGSYYNIDPDKEIYFMCLATALEQAKNYQYADLVSVITRCNALSHSIGKVQEETFTIKTSADEQYLTQMKAKGIKVGRDFAKLRGVPKSANADSIRGSATMAVVFDEMAFMTSIEGNSSSAEACYSAAEPSLAQFGKDGMMFLNSSPYTKIGKFYERWEQSMEMDGNTPKFPALFSFQFPSWELYKDYDKDPQRRFKSAIMVSPDIDFSVIDNPEDIDKAREARFSEESNPDKFKVERRGQWAEVIDSYLNPENVDRAFVSEYKNAIVKMNTSGTYVNNYVGHCDPSSTTAGFGFAMGHTQTFKDEQGNAMPHVILDVVKRWDPKSFPGKTIQYEVIIEELVNWIDAFRPKEFSFDQYYSNILIQSLRGRLMDKNITCRIIEKTATAKNNMNKYEAFKTALNLDLVHIPQDCTDSEYAKMELKFLQMRNGRVDKQDIGPIQTKDVADCIAEVTATLLGGTANDIIGLHNSRLQAGAQSGYGIGRRRDFESFYKDTARSPVSPTRSMGHRNQRKIT